MGAIFSFAEHLEDPSVAHHGDISEEKRGLTDRAVYFDALVSYKSALWRGF